MKETNIEKEKENEEELHSPYYLTSDLINKRCEYDLIRAYFPAPNPIENPDKFFAISRARTKKITLKYTWVSKKNDGTFVNLASFTRNKLLNEEEIDEDKKSNINRSLANAGRRSGIKVDEEEFKNYFSDLFDLIINADCLEVFKDEFYEFPPAPKQIGGEIDEYQLKIQKEINYRKNPTLDNKQEQQAREVGIYIKKHGLIKYLETKINKLQLGEHKNIYRKLLAAFNIIRGKGSYLIETIADAEEGKSLEDEIVFYYLIPEEYIFNKNDMSVASFLRYSEADEEFFTRLIILWGDLGKENAYKKVEDVFDIMKILITEKNYSKDLAEKERSGEFKNKSLDLKVESIGGAYSTVKNSFTNNDSQLESRTISSTPFGTDKSAILDHMGYLNTELSQQSHDLKQTIAELVSFKSYLLSLVSFDKEIINPYVSVFKRYVQVSKTQIREFKQLMELFDAYCVLTHESCKEIDGNLVASESQLNGFFENVCLENVLIPYESNFIKMLLGKGKKELTVVEDAVTEDEENLDPLNEYFNAALEKYEKVNVYTELEEYEQRSFINKLLQLYKLLGTSSDHKENVFFRKTDVKRAYSTNKAYKNINDVNELLYALYIKGYLGKLEFKCPTTHQNIYYATSKCENIKVSVKLSEEDRKAAQEFLKNIGLYDADEA